jgi:hypothetical protein
MAILYLSSTSTESHVKNSYLVQISSSRNASETSPPTMLMNDKGKNNKNWKNQE